MKRRRLNSRGIVALLVLVFVILTSILAIVDKIRYELNESRANKNYQLVINEEEIKPNQIVSKNNFVFDHSSKKYVDVKIPKNSTLNLKGNYSLTNEDGEKIKGDITYLPDGKYTLKTEINKYKYVYHLNVDNDFFVEIDQTYSKQGGFIVASFHDLNKDEDVTFTPNFKSSEEFKFDKNKTVIPIDYSNKPGEHKIDFTSEKSAITNTINVAPTEHERIVLYWDDYEKKQEEESETYTEFLAASSLITDEQYYTTFSDPTNGTIVSNYGDTFHINNSEEPTVINLAVDYSNSLNTPITPTSDGVVAFTGELEVLGKVIVIDHGNGITSTYAHLNEIVVEKGTVVNQGTIIGKMGESGNVRGVHLNFEISLNGIKVDPNIFLYSELNF